MTREEAKVEAANTTYRLVYDVNSSLNNPEFPLVDKIYDDFESRVCGNCGHGVQEDLGIYCPFVNYCGTDYMDKDFGCNEFKRRENGTN